jgi:YidC/Oxa1 family membrane protein insertase
VKELSTEQRLLLALVLSVVVVTVSDLFVFRRMKTSTPAQTAQKTAPVSGAATPAKSAAPVPQPAAAAPAALAAATAAAKVAPQAAQPQEEGSKEEDIVVESPLYRVVLSNRGAVVRRWQLKRYGEESTPKKVLDAVHPPANPQSNEWPLSLLMVDPKLQAEANGAIFQMKPGPTTLQAPAEVDFQWSDGHLTIVKQIKFGTGYVADLHTSVTLNGQPVAYAVAWRGGFGDQTVYRAADQVEIYFATGGNVSVLASKKLGTRDHPEVPALASSDAQFAGIEDRYFAAAFLPTGTAVSAWDWRTQRQTPGAAAGTEEAVAEVAVGAPETTPGPVSLRLFVGPKSLHELGQVNPALRSLVHYGIMGFIAEPLFYFLRWIHDYVPNWGWAIVMLTLVLNMALFPLKLSSWRSMQKMQKVMPEMKAIQARYKKYKMNDPRRQKMNEEMMALYQKEGVNPMGSCLPMLLQMPVWFALYEMLEVAIELRQAPWFGWIHDLSAHDPYYILPILMTIAGYGMQKMTPMTSPDPNQQRMMNFMPVIFGLLFFRLSSGLILYIFTSYLIGIGQQWYLNKTSPVSPPGAASGKVKRKSGSPTDSGPGSPTGRKLKRQEVEG